jgi:hypothetical protein
MGPLFVVFNLPPVGDLPDLIQSPEEIEIKHFGAICPVEPFNVRVLIRFSGVNILDAHSCRLGPGYKLTGKEFRSVVRPQHLGKASFQA